MSFAIDIAWDRPTVAQIQATGASGVLRYLSPDPTKNITAAEVSEYHAAGLGTGVVWEGSATRALDGRAAGIADAQAAEQQRAAVGLPADQPIYFAVDTDTDWASVAAYFDGAHSVLGATASGVRRTGTYGGLRVIDGAAAAGFHYLWQTLAWSGGQRSSHAVLYQDGRTVLSGNADINQILAPDWGQYPSPSGGDMPLTPADVQAIWDHTEINVSNNQATRMGAIMRYADFLRDQQTKQLTAQLGALSAAVSALAKGGGLTAEQVQAAAKAGADAALAEAEAAAKRVVDALQSPAPSKP